MSQHAWEDLDTFLQVDEFATWATVRLQAGAERRIRGIFDDPYLNAELGEYELDSTRPRLTCRWADVRDVTRGDVVEIEGVAYDVVTNAQPDGTGMGLLALAEQRA